LLKNQQGTIEIFGKEFLKNRIGILKKIGSLIEQPSLYAHLTAKENLEVYRKIYRTDKKEFMKCLNLLACRILEKRKLNNFL
jgi:ABC-2 type transport system ATP-binding protein